MATWATKGAVMTGHESAQGATSRPVTLLDVFDQHYRDVHGYLARRVDAHTAEDLVSETSRRPTPRPASGSGGPRRGPRPTRR